jgi:hypothetical protein
LTGNGTFRAVVGQPLAPIGMGDCRIRFLEPSEGKTTTSVSLAEVSAGIWSSDTTIYDCFRSVKTINKKEGGQRRNSAATRNLWESMADDRVVSIWDCTKYPPANITDICLTTGREMTLYAAGWFPSGTIQILPADAVGIVFASADAHQDFQFNQEQTRLDPREAVKLIGKTFDSDTRNGSGGKVKPSQVLDAIPVRFVQTMHNIDEEEDDHDITTAEAVRLRQQNKLKRRAVETERARKLDERIRKLNARPSSKTSQQVRRMLIKSRATGRKTLREEDRVYFHVCFDGDGNDDGDGDGEDESHEDYRFFSHQDTVGAALGSFQTRSRSSNCEMLVSLDGSYYRLPSSLRFLDVMERKALASDVTTVVVRFYTEGEPTTSIDERVTEEEVCPAQVVPDKDNSCAGQTIPHDAAMTVAPTSDVVVAEVKTSIDSMALLLVKLRELYPKPAKKQSPALLKVQQMKIKGKAKGDPKRIKSVDDRFFFELVIASSQNDWQPLLKGPVYYALTDPVDRCCADIGELQADDVASWSVWIFVEDQLLPISSSKQSSRSKSWQSLLQQGDVTQFSIIVWCLERINS